ncbi:TonB-dependent receptor SusC [Kordia antarctica]|uniref:TonB-dependent receptor SusC n=1 Tax=Kordia antarctica TaxID=1218801 RepID=A0A7L4ZQP5_9FLAO|nr:VWA domain-containing protein [Kordia antarctica]QHI38841.1 TonB-dependent receptor SusC [Kordia antarctica]
MKKLVTLFILLAISSQVWAQKIEVSGTVTDDTGLPLPGASVIIKGTSTGKTTDFDGNYKVNTNNGAILVFTYVGFISQEVKVTSSIINVQLKQGGTLDEVVIVGYGSVKESKSLGYAVSTVESRSATRKERRRFRREARKNTKDAQNGTNNVLNGAASGVQVTSGNGQAIQIRGRSSLQNGYATQTSITSNESYKEINENIFKRTSLAPLSTFSIDVDKAAYSNIRRMINNGQKVPVDAVKIEEMINYFEYNYTQPIDTHPFAVHTEVGVTPWNKDTKLLKIALKGKEIPLAEIPPSNFTFLIDVSGSMSAQNKLPLLKSAFKLMVNKMRPEDKVAIVVYAGAAGLVLEPTSGDNKQKIMNALDNLQAGGSTAGGQGIELAYKIAVENFIKDGNNRVIMATDGDFNVGQTSTASMEKLIEEKRKSGVFLSVLGFGMGNYKHDKLEALADKGNGNHAYIDTMQEAHKIFGKEFGGTLYTIAKDVKLQLEFNPNIVQGYRLIGYENRLLADEDFKDDTKDAGELGAGHTVTALYEIIPVGVKTEYLKSVDDLKYTKTTTSSESFTKELLTVKLRYKKPNEDKSQELKTVVENVLTSKLSSDFKFTAAVALFGMQLKDSEFHNNSSLDNVIALAKSGRGEDKSGYRAEFIRLVESSVTK